MATSTLIIYEPLDSLKDNREYWSEYAEFYEKYWGGPTSPFGVWFGNEYNSFRVALAKHLDMEESHLMDCFFMKNNKNQYYIAPISEFRSENIITSEDYIPLVWFVLFHETERKTLFTHWGFNAISYDANINSSISRLELAESIINSVNEKLLSTQSTLPFISFLNQLKVSIEETKNWLFTFHKDGIVVLNYGDICSFIQPYTLKNENTVKEVFEFLSLIDEKEYDKADSLLKVILQKWDELRNKCKGNEENIVVH